MHAPPTYAGGRPTREDAFDRNQQNEDETDAVRTKQNESRGRKFRCLLLKNCIATVRGPNLVDAMLKSLFFSAVGSLLLTACGGAPPSFSVRPPAVEIASPATPKSAVPYLVTDDSGNLRMSWTETEGDLSTMYFSTLTDENWSAPVRVASGLHWFVNWADVPVIAGDGAGNLIANYLVRSGTRSFGYDLHLVRSRDFGQSWGDPVIPHDDRTQTEHGFAALVPLEEGQYLVAWLDGRNNTPGMRKKGGSQSLRAAFLNPDGELRNEGHVDLRVCDCCQPAAVRLPDGPAILYRDRSGAEIRDISIVWWVGGKWLGPFPVAHDNWEIHGCPVDGPKADNNEHTLVAAWFTAAQGEPRVHVAFSDDRGRTFGEPIRVDDGKALGKPDVVLLGAATAMVSWLARSNEHEVIRARKVFKDGRSEASLTIAAITGASGFPQMAAFNGKVYFAWSDGHRVRTAYLQP